MKTKSSAIATRTDRVDRRVQKTKRHLSQALIALIVEKGYERVTVQDILDKADVGRSTFYAHYESKDVLLVDGPRNLGLALLGEGAAADVASRHHPMAFRTLFEHVNESRPLAKAMLGKHAGSVILDAFRAKVADAIRRHCRHEKRPGRQDLIFRYITEAAATAVMSLLSSWSDDDFALPVDAISNRCQRLVEGILEL